MLVSYEWLSEYIDPGMNPEELAEKLNLTGIEVGSVERFGPELPGVIVGQVKAMEPHPSKKKLTLVETETGEGVTSIVCGARNMQVGDKVVVAKPGSELPGGHLIEETLIGGVSSAGMLCSAQELGLDLDGEDEILILDQEAVVGSSAEEALGFDDYILELELTPNRADCLGLIGVAYEISAITGNSVRFPEMVPPENDEDINDTVSIKVEDQELCPRYTTRAVRDVVIGKAPLWMQLRLLKAGIRPINNVVDITNYVMWEFGQPLHAFDLDLIRDNKIIVRRACQDETLVTLDGVERKLTPEALVIVDGKVPVGLAGVMGGEDTEITALTTQVLIEAANFNPTNIRRTARRYNLPSEASQRFEKGVNPEAAIWAQERTALLIKRFAGGRVLKGIIDLNYLNLEPKTVLINPERINKILGLKIPEKEVAAIMGRLGFTYEDKNTGQVEVTVPLRRADITIEEDLVEEVARLYGYDQIPTTLPGGKLHESRESDEEKLYNLVRTVLTAGGYYECITYSFINPESLGLLRIPNNDRRRQVVPVRNPFTDDQSVMRTTLLPGLLRVMKHNLSHRELNQMLFEIGSIYEPKNLPLKELPRERKMVSLAVTGLEPEPNWIKESRETDYFTVKGILDSLLTRIRIDEVDYVPRAVPFLHPTRSAVLEVDGKELGCIGQLHPDIAEELEIGQAVTVCELDLELISDLSELIPRVTTIPRFPAAKRDLALVVSKDISAKQLEDTIREAGGDLVRDVTLFDLYEGKQIPEGKRSLAYSLTFRRDEGTLTDEEVNEILSRVQDALYQIGAALRS